MRRDIPGIVAVVGLVAVFTLSADGADTAGSVLAGLPVFGPEDPQLAGLPILSESPIRWVPPETFNVDLVGRGIPDAPGVEHTVIYDPYPSDANINEGGTGRYEGVLHGTFNHHPGWQFFGDYVITQWTNHTRDENGPGQRVLSRLGRFVDKDGPNARIDWGDPAHTTVEVAPPPVPVMRRYSFVHPDTIYPYIEGGIGVYDGRIFVTAHLVCIGGYTTQEALRRPSGPQPASEYSDGVDRRGTRSAYEEIRPPRGRPVGTFLDSVYEARRPEMEARRRQMMAQASDPRTADSVARARRFRYDFWFDLGMNYVQEWKIANGTLVPAGPMYQTVPQKTRVEVTPGRWKVVAPLQPPYTDMVPISRAPRAIRRMFEPRPEPPAPPAPPKSAEEGRRERAIRDRPQFKDGAAWLAADGKHGLAHFTEYRRPDGVYVSIRDNLLNGGHYYASIRDSLGFYPPAVETNLYGWASPSAGTLPDGRIYILCNSQSRNDMFMVLSRDGIVFDRTWNIKYKGGGPQYYAARIVGPNMWVFYSIRKVQMGVTKVPLASL